MKQISRGVFFLGPRIIGNWNNHTIHLIVTKLPTAIQGNVDTYAITLTAKCLKLKNQNALD